MPEDEDRHTGRARASRRDQDVEVVHVVVEAPDTGAATVAGAMTAMIDGEDRVVATVQGVDDVEIASTVLAVTVGEDDCCLRRRRQARECLERHAAVADHVEPRVRESRFRLHPMCLPRVASRRDWYDARKRRERERSRDGRHVHQHRRNRRLPRRASAGQPSPGR